MKAGSLWLGNAAQSVFADPSLWGLLGRKRRRSGQPQWKTQQRRPHDKQPLPEGLGTAEAEVGPLSRGFSSQVAHWTEPPSRCLPASEKRANNISMKVTPRQAVQQLEVCLSEIREALHTGIDYANDLQPELGDRDPWYWSHGVRFAARRRLEQAQVSPGEWEIIDGVPNSGIHVRLQGIHVVRVLRSVAGTTPAPGRNRVRQEAWQQCRQLQLPLDYPHSGLPPIDLILDWTTNEADDLEMHLGLPQGIWGHGNSPILAWRVPLPSGDTLDNLAFDGADEDDIPIVLRVDDADTEAM